MTIEHEDARGRKHLVASPFVQGAAIVLRDEIHRDKGNQAKPTGRAKVMLAVGEYMRSVKRAIVGATGTLLTNRPVEGYLPLTIIGGDALVQALTPGARKASGFLWRYCAPVQQNFGGRSVTTFSGIDLDEAHRLHEYLRRTVYVRREKSDLGNDVLPHSGWIVTPLALTDDAMRRYRRVEKDFLTLVQEEKGAEAMWRANKAQAIVQMNMLCEAAVDYAKQFTDEGEQVVMFYYHADTYLALAKACSHAGISYTTINGKVTGDARVDAVQEFQAGDCQVVLAQIKAAGMAVTLTAAPHAVFVQVPWSAGDLKQAADRILRVDNITRDRAAAGGKVQWHVLQSAYSDGDLSFDAAMWSVLENKAHVCDAVNAGRPITMPEESVMYQALLAWAPSAKRHGGW
jgi:SWI/SNF-related matrix-associated actin-dependent regulator 1 of chromatin subfamily A